MATAAELIQIDLAPKRPVSKPEWLKARAPVGENYHDLKRLARSLDLHTVCESAQCPNIGECWHHKTATFMMLGNLCTRRCGFCAVPKGRPEPIDFDEPRRVAEAVATLGLQARRHHQRQSRRRPRRRRPRFAMVIDEIRRQAPGCRVEVLIPDFQGNEDAIRIVVDAHPEVLNHNTESVPRLYRVVRSGARYERTLSLLASPSSCGPTALPSPASWSASAKRLTNFSMFSAISRPSALRHPHHRPVSPPLARPSADGASLHAARIRRTQEAEALKMGFRHVESGPLVRSCYHAHEQADPPAAVVASGCCV